MKATDNMPELGKAMSREAAIESDEFDEIRGDMTDRQIAGMALGFSDTFGESIGFYVDHVAVHDVFMKLRDELVAESIDDS